MKKSAVAGMLTMLLAFSLSAAPFGEELTGSGYILTGDEPGDGALTELTDAAVAEPAVPVGDEAGDGSADGDTDTGGDKEDVIIDGDQDVTDGGQDSADGNADDGKDSADDNADDGKDNADGNEDDNKDSADDNEGDSKDDTDGNDDAEEDDKEYLAEGDGWRLDTEGNLEFTAAGALPSASFQGSPLYEYRDQILTVAFADGVTAIGRYLFQDLDARGPSNAENCKNSDCLL